MKRFLIGLFGALLCGISLGADIIASGSASPIINVILFQTADGITPITTLSGTNITLYYAEEPTGSGTIGDEVTVECTDLANTHTAYSSGAAIHVGGGVYRICLPIAAVDGAAGTKVTVRVTDETAAARTAYKEILLSPSVNTALINGNVPSAAPTNFPSLSIDANGFVTVADDSITAAKIATDAIGASEIATDAAMEIASGGGPSVSADNVSLPETSRNSFIPDTSPSFDATYCILILYDNSATSHSYHLIISHTDRGTATERITFFPSITYTFGTDDTYSIVGGFGGLSHTNIMQYSPR
jgi:hypothetical protein